MLWNQVISLLIPLRESCARRSTFFWLLTAVVCLILREDLVGVTSFIRAGFLLPECYQPLIDFFNGQGVKLDRLNQIWCQTVLKILEPFLVRNSGRILMIGDGIKTPKEGRHMPGVKSCHQESENSSKPEFIMGHSFQMISVLVKFGPFYFAIPLIMRIHEGIKTTNRDHRTIHDKLLSMFLILPLNPQEVCLVLDSYYCVRTIFKPLRELGVQVIARARSNTVAYLSPRPQSPHKRGRKPMYGEKIILKNLPNSPELVQMQTFVSQESPNLTVEVFSICLMWRPMAEMMKFIFIKHPRKGNLILITNPENDERSTVMNSYLLMKEASTEEEVHEAALHGLRAAYQARDFGQAYGFRFQIEHTFKKLVYSVGAFTYRFFVKGMKKTRKGDTDQHLHRTPKDLKERMLSKIHAYELYANLSAIALGCLQILCIRHPTAVWENYDGWLRNMSPDRPPTEIVALRSLKTSFYEFLRDSDTHVTFKKFWFQNQDPRRSPIKSDPD
jgi:hypothetical protein